MARRITRNDFLHLGVRLAGLGMAGILVACGDDDDDDVADGTTTTNGTTTTDGTTTTTTTTTDGATTTTTTDGATTTGADGTTGAAACESVDTEVGPPSEGPEHTHMVTVPPEDVEAGTEQTYTLTMGGGHIHEVTVTEEMFTMLQDGDAVMVDTTEDATLHVHVVIIECV